MLRRAGRLWEESASLTNTGTSAATTVLCSECQPASCPEWGDMHRLMQNFPEDRGWNLSVVVLRPLVHSSSLLGRRAAALPGGQ